MSVNNSKRKYKKPKKVIKDTSDELFLNSDPDKLDKLFSKKAKRGELPNDIIYIFKE